MALDAVGKSEIEILCQKKTGEVREIVCIGDATLTRTANQPSSLKLKVRRNDVGPYTPENGDIITLTVDKDHDMFWGYITETQKSERTVDIVAYDQLWYLNQSTYSKSYGTISASDLYIKMADDFGFNMVDPPTVEDTVYKIVNVILDKAKPMDIMVDALNITYEHTGFRYFIYDAFNNLCLARGEHPETLKVNTLCINHFNCKEYTYTESLSGTYNVVHVVRQSNDGKPAETATKENEQAVKDYGRLEYTTDGAAGENLEELASKILKDKEGVSIKLTCNDVIGDPRVFGGSNVFVDLFTNGLEDSREYIRGWFEVDSVTHKFSNATHYMDLDLSLVWMYDDWEYPGIDPDFNYEKEGKDTTLW